MRTLWHESSALLLARLQEHLPHAILLVGPRGSGLSTFAREIGGDDITRVIEPLSPTDEPSANGTIKVDAIRKAYTHTMGKRTKRQIVVIDSAETMNTSAQNALLKLLEEPNSGVHFILLAHDVDPLLPTILSRTQRYDIAPLSREQSELLANSFDLPAGTVAQIVFVADGLPAEIVRLATDESYRTARFETMRMAKQFIGSRGLERLVAIKSHMASRQAALEFTEAVCKLLTHQLSSAPSDDLHNLLCRAEQSHTVLLRLNASPKLQLLRLMV